jgi:predicted FMN-binding regulatory protein PaiB
MDKAAYETAKASDVTRAGSLPHDDQAGRPPSSRRAISNAGRCGRERPQAAHIPMILNRDASGKPVSLEGHVANNPAAAVAVKLVRALAIFNGATPM